MKFVIEHLSKSFEKKEVLRDIDFTFDEGKIYGLLGRNGAGKTTLFNCLNRDIKTDSGNFYIDTDGVRREVTADDIGYVLSTPTVPEFLTGREFLKFFMDINEKSIKNPKSIDEYFDYMSIEPEDRDKLLKDYSHGMKNKMQSFSGITSFKCAMKFSIMYITLSNYPKQPDYFRGLPQQSGRFLNPGSLRRWKHLYLTHTSESRTGYHKIPFLPHSYGSLRS